MKIFNKKLVVCFLLFVVSFFIIMPSFVMADDYGLKGTVEADTEVKSALVDKVETDIPKLIGKLIGVVLSFVGVVFFILVIYGGFLWMTARGDSAQVEKAKDLLYAATIGLVIVLAAYAITSFIGTQITGP